MPTIAIVGAGPGLGLSLAKVFGAHGHGVALISRSRAKLDGLVGTLAEAGVTAEGFPADASDHAQLAGALTAAADRFGGIDVLEFSPYAGLVRVQPAEVTVENLRGPLDELLLGAVTAVQAVLPGMLERGKGTLLFTTGGGAINPYPMLSTLNIAQAGLRNWVHNLHNTLADKGIYAATVAINVMIAERAPAGYPHRSPDDIAAAFWDMHTGRTESEIVING
jgi:NADP-dependent 3-hydroxy acid dehydrogenase YdfG